MKEHAYDYIIVGAGSAGCVLATHDLRVLLLEFQKYVKVATLLRWSIATRRRS